jgi:hypothetical protein
VRRVDNEFGLSIDRHIPTPTANDCTETMIAQTTTTKISTVTTTRPIATTRRSTTTTARPAVKMAAAKDEQRDLREGELDVKRGLFSVFIKDGASEVSAEKFQAYQAEIAERKAEAKRRQEEARANRKGPFGLW